MYLKFENGFLFKDFMEFISTSCNNQTCWLEFTNDGLRISHESECDDEKCPAKWYVDAVLYSTGFLDYDVEKYIRINVDPKKIVKLCRNVKKKDNIELNFDETKADILTMTFKNGIKIEQKVVPHIGHSYVDTVKMNIPFDMFVGDKFKIASVEISNLKKAVGNKKESIYISFIGSPPSILEFSAYSQFLSPLKITYNQSVDVNDNNYVSRVVVSGTVLNVISKMTGLSKELNLYSISKKYENKEADNGWIKISCEISCGYINMYVMAKLT